MSFWASSNSSFHDNLTSIGDKSPVINDDSEGGEAITENLDELYLQGPDISPESEIILFEDTMANTSDDVPDPLADMLVNQKPTKGAFWTNKDIVKKIIPATKEYTKLLIARQALEGAEFAYMSTPTNTKPLSKDVSWFPNIENPVVQVVESDTYDAAIDVMNGEFLENTSDFMPVCVLNHANAYRAGGGWENGAHAQEEQLFYRSTLSGTLRKKLFPMGSLDCAYSPHVIIFRENISMDFKFLAELTTPAKLPVVSVISMAAESQPKLTDDGTTYADDTIRGVMYNKLLQVLRTAAHNNHRRLVLGALGCGAFGHPVDEVTDLWRDALEEEEFTGWFEQIIFAVIDRTKAKPNLRAFQAALDNAYE